MKTTYFVWEDPSCEGISPNWLELSGQEFLALVRSAEAVGRYFVKMEDAQEGTATVIEATRASYLAWKKDKNRQVYLKACAKAKPTVSYHALVSDGGVYGEELLEDRTADVLSECLISMTRETLKDALASLTSDEYKLIAYLYLFDRRGTVRGYARLTKTTKSTVNRRKDAVLLKLKKYFEKSAGQIQKNSAIE